MLQVQLLNAEHNPDVMLLAARAITFLADVLPSSCSSIVRHGAVPAFCARLLTIEYIDLAEQSLQVKTYLPQFVSAFCPAHSTGSAFHLCLSRLMAAKGCPAMLSALGL